MGGYPPMHSGHDMEGQGNLKLLHTAGVGPLGGNGAPQPRGMGTAKDPLRPSRPADRLLSRLLSSAAVHASEALLEASAPEERIRIL